jgi:hypothetical protein
MPKRTDAQKRADAAYDKKRAGKRTRNWAFLLYPESCDTAWRDLLGQMCIPAFVSPLHDQDTWTAYDEQENEAHKQGEPKKAHYHVMFMFSSVKTYEQVMEKVELLKGTSCVPIEDVKAYARYLCHTGQKDKAQYSPDDVLQFGGADYAETVEGTGDKVKVIAEMESWIEEQGIDSYHVLSRYARTERPDWYRVLVWNGRHIKDVMQAMTWERKEQERAQAQACVTARECHRPNEGETAYQGKGWGDIDG